MPDRASRADQPIGDPAAGQAQNVGSRDVEPIDRRGGPIIEAEAAPDGVGEKQHEDRPHSVIGEAFPHLGEEQRHEAAGVAEDLRSARGIALYARVQLDALAHLEAPIPCDSL